MTRVTQAGQGGGNAVAPKRVDFGYDVAGRLQTVYRYAALAGAQLVVGAGLPPVSALQAEGGNLDRDPGRRASSQE
jgi:hypothetical protein